MILLLARLLLAATFAVAAIGKLLDRPGAAKSLRGFGTPAPLAAVGAIVLPLAELAVAALLVPSSTAIAGAIGALALLGLFAIAIGVAIARGQRPDCNCFGNIHSRPVGWTTLARNAALAAVAVALIAAGPGRPLDQALDGVAASTALAVGALVLVLLGQLALSWQLFRQNGRLIVRVRTLEQQAGIEAEAQQPSRQGLDEGVPAPRFTLPDLEGRPVSLDQLLSADRKLALVFSDPGCGGCIELLPELGRLERERAAELLVALISTGDPADNQARTNGSGLSTVLLQDQHEVTTAYAVRGMPAAVIVDRDGQIASPLAVGGPRVVELLADAANVKTLEVMQVPFSSPQNVAALTDSHTAAAIQPHEHP